MSKPQQYLQDLKTHQEEELEVIIQSKKSNDSEESEDDQNDILNMILQCQQRGQSERVFDFNLGNSIKLCEVDDMNKSALYLDALAWLYSTRVDRTYVESLKLKVNLLRVYDQSTNIAAPTQKKNKQQVAQQIKPNIIRHIEQKDITKYGESTLDFKQYTYQYNTLQINPFFNQTSKSLDMQDLTTLIIYNPQFDQNLEIIIDPDQLLQTNEQNKQILTGFIKLEIDTSVLDYSNLVSKHFKTNFTEINEFRIRYKYLLDKNQVQPVKIEKSQQLQLDKFVNHFRVYDEKLQQAQQVIEAQNQIKTQINQDDLQFESLNQQYQQQLQINQTQQENNMEESLNKQIENLQLEPQLTQEQIEQQIKQQELSQKFQKYHQELLEEQKKQQQQINQQTNMEVEEFNNLLPDQVEFDYGGEIQQIINQDQQQELKPRVDQKITLQEQFLQQQKEAQEKQQQIVQQQAEEKQTYQQQYQDIFNEINANAPMEEWEMDPEDEFDQELLPYEEQQLQQQKQINQPQQQQQQQPQGKKKQKKIYPDTFDFNDASELHKITVLNSVGNQQRDFGQRELQLKYLIDSPGDFDYFRFFEYFTREFQGFLEEEEYQAPIVNEPEKSLSLDQVEYENLSQDELSQMIEQYKEDKDHYVLPFKVQANNGNEPITIKQLQVILERVINSIEGDVEFLKLEKTFPLIMTEKISKSKLFAALLFVSKSQKYQLEQKDLIFKDIRIKKPKLVDLEMDFER